MTKEIKWSERPIYHELKYKKGFYDKVIWPCCIEFGAKSSKMVTVRNNATYTTGKGTEYSVTSIRYDRVYPILTYRIDGKGRTDNGSDFETSVSWFAYNVAFDNPGKL